MKAKLTGIMIGLFVMAIGWVFNIVKLVEDGSTSIDFTLMMLFRLIGVFFIPLGSVLGFL